MKHLFLFLSSLIIFINVFSQGTTKHQWAGRCMTLIPEISAEASSSNAAFRTIPGSNPNLNTATLASLIIYVPLVTNNGCGSTATTPHKIKYTLGMNLQIGYGNIPTSDVTGSVNTKYILDGGSIHPQFTDKKGNSIFEVSVGPKAKFEFNKFYTAPSVQFGFMSIKQNGYTVQDSIANPNQPSEKALVTFAGKTASTSSGFLLKPQLEFGYHLSNSWSVYTKASYSFGPTLTTNLQTLTPEGGFTPNNTYNYNQLQGGTITNTTTATKWKAFGVAVGLTYKFSSKK